MKINNLFKIYSTTILLLFTPILGFSGANLVIHPTRIVFEKDEKAAQIDVTNTGDQSGTYRISIENKRMDEMGAFIEVTKAITGELFADELIQFSPRQSELAPGAGQTVRILLKKPADLPPGEYRSHLKFARIPDANTTSIENANKLKDGEIGISLTALVGISIPIIVRSGPLESSVTISDMKVSPATKTDPAFITLNLNRTGNKSTYGDLFIYLVTDDGKEEKIATASGVAVYSPNKIRKSKIILRQDFKQDISKLKLKAIYQEQDKTGGKILAELNSSR